MVSGLFHWNQWISQPPGLAVAPPSMTMQAKPSEAANAELPIEDLMPSLAGAQERLNSPPLSLKALKGKVMLRFLDHGVQAYALTFG
jgi:hypothetical protein